MHRFFTLACLAFSALYAQEPAPQRPATGVATGAAHAPIKDAQQRPITAGGFVENAPVVFTDVTAQSGLLRFKSLHGTPAKKYILETPGSGVAFIDYDNDGWQDIYLLNGSTFDALRGKTATPRAALFRNNRDGKFIDVTEKAGVANERWGCGIAVGDYDNDGWPDIYVSNYGKNRLYHNNRNGTFTDVAEKAGVAVDSWSTGPTWGDYDGDGKLDLFVPGYIKFDINRLPESSGVNPGYRGQVVMFGPRGLDGARDHLFHNNGDGTFTDVSEKAGVADPPGYYGFSSAFADVNNDGKLDLIVANDSTPNYLYMNKGDGTFEDLSYLSGFAVSEGGQEQAGMGLGIGDYNNDGSLDLYVTNFSDDYNTLYKNQGDGNFDDVSFKAGVADPTIPFLGWGTGFFDFDNDGWKDIFVANGHVYPAVNQNDWGMSWAQRPLLFRNTGQDKFYVMPAATGSGLAVVIPARGMAFGDLFNDGKLAVVINNMDAPPTLLRNVNQDSNHWITLLLAGGPKNPADAIGASVLLTSGNVTQRQDVISGGSFASSPDLRLHFGLGSATKIDKLEIRWPNGSRETVVLPAVDRIYTIREGKGAQPIAPAPK